MQHSDDEVVRFVAADDHRDAVDGAFHNLSFSILTIVPDAMIFHIGSTAIPGSLTKLDLDVQVIVAAERFEEAQRALAASFERNEGNPPTATFASFKDDSSPIPLGVQLTSAGSKDDLDLQRIQTLLAKPENVASYNALKRAHEGRSMKAYREAEAAYLQQLLANR